MVQLDDYGNGRRSSFSGQHPALTRDKKIRPIPAFPLVPLLKVLTLYNSSMPPSESSRASLQKHHLLLSDPPPTIRSFKEQDFIVERVMHKSFGIDRRFLQKRRQSNLELGSRQKQAILVPIVWVSLVNKHSFTALHSANSGKFLWLIVYDVQVAGFQAEINRKVVSLPAAPGSLHINMASCMHGIMVCLPPSSLYSLSPLQVAMLMLVLNLCSRQLHLCMKTESQIRLSSL